MSGVQYLFAGLAVIGLGLTTVQLLAAWLFMGRRRPFAEGLRGTTTRRGVFRQAASDAPRVSILKPVAGVDDGFRENLTALAKFTGSAHEIIVSIASEHDPAVQVVREVIDAVPSAPLRLVIGGNVRSANPKVERLIAAMEHARGDIIVISDAQVGIEQDQLTATVSDLDDSSVGVVSNLFVGDGARSFGAWIESTHLLTFVAAGNTLAALANVPCLVGKSMAIRRDVLNRIGGFEAFSGVLAEDQAIAIAVRRAGYRVVLSRCVVRNRVELKSLRAAVARQVRWNKIRFSFSPALYSAELLMHPVVWSLLASVSAVLIDGSGTFLLLAATTTAARMAQTCALAVLFGAASPLRLAMITPIQDVLQFAAQLMPFISRQVNWRGHRARLGRGTVIQPLPVPR